MPEAGGLGIVAPVDPCGARCGGPRPAQNGFAGLSLTDRAELDALRAGDQRAFTRLIDRNHAAMVRVARGFVPSWAVAEEVVQDTWCAVVENLHHFEGRSTLKTWIFRILCNRAKGVGQHERRSVPLSALFAAEAQDGDGFIDAERLLADRFDRTGWWADPPRPFPVTPEDAVLSREAIAVVEQAIESLRPGQRTVITLRDVVGWRAQEVCVALDISEINQRVLLHRARSTVRQALELHYAAA